jgi:hypothetical protein
MRGRDLSNGCFDLIEGRHHSWMFALPCPGDRTTCIDNEHGTIRNTA